VQLIRAGIVGASGYAGGEVFRLLLGHPNVNVVFATAHEQAGRLVADVHPNLRSRTSLRFLATPGSDKSGNGTEALPWSDVDVVFLCLPHGQSMRLVSRMKSELPANLKIVDLGGDFRLRDGAVFEKYYHEPHIDLVAQAEFAYGLPEFFGTRVREARRVASPGCFATAAALGLGPLARSALVDGPVIIDAKTGSSGSGVRLGAATHHPERAEAFCAYKPFAHQHLPEIQQTVRDVAPDWSQDITLQTHSAPMIRGIFASIYVRLIKSMTTAELRAFFSESYRGAPFVRVVDGSPNVAWVRGSNFCDIGVAADGRSAVVFVAIDNMIKGAAGQGVQNMNLMFGLDEAAGLGLLGGHP